MLERGRVAIVKHHAGEDYLLRELAAGDCFGEVALMDFCPRSAAVMAIEDCEAMEFHARDLLQLSRKDPEQFSLVYMNIGRELARREVVQGDGDRVGQFEVVLRLENIMLLAERATLLARLDETRARLQAVFLLDRSEADIFRVKVSSLEAALGDVAEQLRNLEVQSASAGVVSLPMASDLPGRYIKRGEVVGYVAGQGRLSALVAVSQLEIDQVRQGLKSIEVKFGSRPGETFDAQLLRELPQGTDRLPNRMLGSASGGDLAVDARDENGVQLLSNVFLLEIGLPPGLDGNFLGQRVFVRFVHRDESLGKRLARRFSQFVLQAPFV